MPQPHEGCSHADGICSAAPPANFFNNDSIAPAALAARVEAAAGILELLAELDAQ